MIYIWLKHIKVMHFHKSHQDYWESFDYKLHRGSDDVMVENDTPLWND